MPTSIGSSELLLIILVMLILFGGKELPGLIRMMSKGWRKIQQARRQVEDELHDIFEDDEDLKG